MRQSLLVGAAAGALLLGSPSAASSPPAAAAPASTPQMAAAAKLTNRAAGPSTTPDVRSPFAIQGRTAKGAKVQLQVLRGKKWVGLGRPTTAPASGKYSIRTTEPRPGVVRYRTIGTLGKSTAVSNTVAVTIYAWYNLVAVPQANGDGVENVDAKLGGRTYVNSMGYDYGGWVSEVRWDFTVNKKCAEFRALVGPSDNNTNTEPTATATVLLDNIETRQVSATLFKPKPMTVDITDAIRLSVNLRRNDAQGWYYLGTPRIRCFADPTQR